MTTLTAQGPVDVTVGPVAQVPVHPRSGRLWGNVREIGARTDIPSYPLDDLYDRAAIDALRAEVERLRPDAALCAQIIQELVRRNGGNTPGWLIDMGPNVEISRGAPSNDK